MEIGAESPDYEPAFYGAPEPFHAVSFHGFTFNASIRSAEWIQLFEAFFSKLGAIPTLARINADTEQFLQYESFQSKYVQNGRINSIKHHGLGLFVEVDGGAKVRLDFPITADVYFREPGNGNSTFIWRARDGVSYVEIFNWLACELLSLSNCPYGYAFQRDARFGPGGYIAGGIVGIKGWKDPVEIDAIKRIGAWAREHWPENTEHRYRTRMLRDVYRAQLVSRSHLETQVFGSSLMSWIEAKSARGRLKEIAKDRFIWTIDGPDLFDVREDLAPSGVLISEERGWNLK